MRHDSLSAHQSYQLPPAPSLPVVRAMASMLIAAEVDLLNQVDVICTLTALGWRPRTICSNYEAATMMAMIRLRNEEKRRSLWTGPRRLG